ncbi:hypothetical protein AMATHDRAFT_1684 [Amanita thiersii Skay4041]|uniref:Sodium/calcium exchanger membrane region domain-containing protein n=1 Tax=Amanita thiersii Skay4041 TaxID=703135 RepID=A0A2A9NYN7_9AGAR|nr:hypothetical protein AMATHDRAFT_1684 [Amanita thiersii Skay4041]
MSTASARFIFIFLFSINCILWSQSRYGQHFDSSQSLVRQSLVKRISSELLDPTAFNSTIDITEKQCRPLAHPITSQCSHVLDACDNSSTLFSLNYLQLYFCQKPVLRPLVFTGLLVWTIFLFSTLGISASDFFTPNLATIAQLLGLDENVAGVTFLAFGNGSPDLFSTFSAMRAGSGSLAIGELLGAASFIVSCVVGSMCIIKPFHVYPKPFLRDVGFFTMAISLLLVILYDGEIRAWEAGFMISLYVIYAFVVVFGSWWDKRQEHKKLHENTIRAEFDDNELTAGFDIPYRDNPYAPRSPELSPLFLTSSTPSRNRAISSPLSPPRLQTNLPPRRAISRSPSPTPSSHVSQLPSFSLLGALEFRDVVASLRNQASSTALSIFESPVTPYAGGHYHHHSLSRSHGNRTPLTARSNRGEVDPWDAALAASSLRLDERTSHPQISVTPAYSPPGEPLDSEGRPHAGDASLYFDDPLNASIPSIRRTPASPSESEITTESSAYIPLTRRQRFVQNAGHVFHTLFPTLHQFRKQSILGQIASVFAAPAVLLLTLTLPVVVTPYISAASSKEKLVGNDAQLMDFEEEGVQRVLIAEEEVEEGLHEMPFNKWLMVAQCVFAPFFCASVLFNDTTHQVWLQLAAGLGGLALAILVAVFADRGDHPTGKIARCSMGFLVSIVWIMAIADEVVNVLQTFGFIFGLSDAIIGLTIFAVGNSLADLVANMTVAAFAPIMGFSACFGGPMLNILLGVGISGTYVINHTSRPYALEFSTSLYVSTIGLLCLLGTTLMFVPFNNYYLTRRWGVFLIASYVIMMTINIIVELKS